MCLPCLPTRALCQLRKSCTEEAVLTTEEAVLSTEGAVLTTEEAFISTEEAVFNTASSLLILSPLFINNA